jgi:hypothetical protein
MDDHKAFVITVTFGAFIVVSLIVTFAVAILKAVH